MLNFEFYNPVKVFFGKGQLENLGRELLNYGRKILLVTYDGPFKKIVPYDAIMGQLRQANKEIFELEGVLPNPRLETVYNGIKICKENGIDLVLAVGGGSVIDCCKTIIIGAKTEKDIWDYFIRKENPERALPLAVVSTMAATGSEMNKNAVITNWNTREKFHITSPLIYPKFSIMDPEFTFTIPAFQTACGAADIISHVLDSNISLVRNIPLQDRFSEAIIKTVVENTSVAIKEPTSYEARSNLMWCSVMALNHLVAAGNEEDWSCHTIEHALSGIYDIPHAAGLTVLTPTWMRYILPLCVEKFTRYAINIWNVNPRSKTKEQVALEGIAALEKFFKNIGMPVTLREIGASQSDFELIANKAVVFGPVGTFKKLEKADIVEILKQCY